MAVLNSFCSLNNVPSSNPSPISPSPPSKPSQVPWGIGINNKDWRRQCFVGMVAACAILNGSSELLGTEAIAGELQGTSVEARGGALKWSERRACPPWQTNSLETIVPENLPRPFKRRISESIRLPFKTSSQTVRPTVKANPGCFTL